MSLRNCSKCGKAYNSPNPYLCPDCIKSSEDDFAAVRNFIKENPKVSMEVVEQATGVPQDRILEFLREGRIETADFDGPVLECKRCGKAISRGQYCVLCQTELSNTFKGGSKPEKKKPEKNRSFAKQYRSKR